ncbi:MAG: M20/M25/M40 family metallo-hydrolase [Gemmatimonadetes bacterium]|nr:M20/M25/M40 family metallo-hydrolase [Gemmatimonadota bacterium]
MHRFSPLRAYAMAAQSPRLLAADALLAPPARSLLPLAAALLAPAARGLRLAAAALIASAARSLGLLAAALIARPTRSLLLLAAALPAPAVLAAQAHPMPTRDALLAPWLAWEEGRYDDALEGYLRALEAPGGEALVGAVAGLTGESFESRELAPDGSGLRVAGDGRWASWEVVEDGRTLTRVVDLANGQAVVATLPGGGAAFVDDGVAYRFVDPEPGPALVEARRAMDQAAGRDAFVAARSALERAEAVQASVRVRSLPSGSERTLDLGGWDPVALSAAPGGPLLVVAYPADGDATDLVHVTAAGSRGLGLQGLVGVVPGPGGAWLAAVVPRAGGSSVVLVDAATGRRRVFEGRDDPAFSADGRTLALRHREGGEHRVEVVRIGPDGAGRPDVVVRSAMEIADPTPSPDGRWIAYAKRPVHDWELFLAPAAGGAERQLSWEIQHDQFPTWVDGSRVLAMKGEGRHRRAYLYEVEGGRPVRLHHNNTVRTIAPEYEWAVVPGGGSVFLVSERDGDTVSPERGVYRVDLTRPVGRAALRQRLESALAAETDLRARGSRAFMPIADRVRPVTEAVSVARIYAYADDLYRFGSKFITRPGNALAIEYIAERLREWGYEPELQWFEPRPGLRSANIIARIPGTVDPDAVYVASSHFDSVERGPGADDDTSGTTALLEAARVLKDHPQPATIELAFFTGEEAGLLGSREYVRRAVAEGKDIVGALNNDMIGWSNGPRLDNTIRYSNVGIRDIQHAAALFFSDLITYDALYYKSTDAAAYYEAYGDIVGGIGSYPVLGNPHYHQFTDRLNTINQRLVAEVSRTTVATLMLLASSPARLRDVRVRRVSGGHEVDWAPAVESTVRAYEVRWTDASGALRTTRVDAVAGGARPSVRLVGARPGSPVSVKAVNARGMEGWDWARATMPR